METIGFTPEDIVDLAVQMEKDGPEFYQRAARIAEAPGQRLMLEGLAAMEQGHAAALVELKKRIVDVLGTGDAEVDAVVTEFLSSWLSGAVFDKDAKVLQTAHSATVADILDRAILIEKESISFYAGLRMYVADTAAEELVDRIIGEELRHVTDLGKATRDLR